jgi:hypothetical protein
MTSPQELQTEPDGKWSKVGAGRSFGSLQELVDYYSNHSLTVTGGYTRVGCAKPTDGSSAVRVPVEANTMSYGELLDKAFRRAVKPSVGQKKMPDKKKKPGAGALVKNDQPLDMHGAAQALLALPYDASDFATFVKVREALTTARNLVTDYPEDDSSPDAEEPARLDWVLQEACLPPSQFIALTLRACASVLGDLNALDDALMASMLQATTNVLQGLELGALRTEDPALLSEFQKVLENLLDGVATAALQGAVAECLVSLVLTRGDLTSILGTMRTLITNPTLRDCHLHPPKILMDFVSAAHTLRFPINRLPGWHDVLYDPTRCKVDAWSIRSSEQQHQHEKPVAMAADGTCIYVHYPSRIVKIGTGFGGSTRGHVVATAPVTNSNDASNSQAIVWMGVVGEHLYRRYSTDTPGIFTRLNSETLLEAGVATQEEGDSLIGALPNALFAAVDALGVIEATPEGWRVRYFEADAGTLKCTNHHLVSSRTVQMMITNANSAKDCNEIKVLDSKTDPIKLVGNAFANLVLTVAGEVFIQGTSTIIDVLLDVPLGDVSDEFELPPEPTDPWRQIVFPKGVVVAQADIYDDPECALFVTTDGRLYGLGDLPADDDSLLSCAASVQDRSAVGLLYATQTNDSEKVVAATIWKGGVIAALDNGSVVSLQPATNDAPPTRTEEGRTLSRSRTAGGSFYCGTLTKEPVGFGQSQGLFGAPSRSTKTCTETTPCDKCKVLSQKHPTEGRLAHLYHAAYKHPLVAVSQPESSAKSCSCFICHNPCEALGHFKSTDRPDEYVCTNCVAEHQTPLLKATPVYTLPKDAVVDRLVTCGSRLLCVTVEGVALWWGDTSTDANPSDTPTMCRVGEHVFATVGGVVAASAKVEEERQVCRVCPECLFCTQYGAECAVTPPDDKSHAIERAKKECGCGKGDPGCVKCGICTACADKQTKAEPSQKLTSGRRKGAQSPLEATPAQLLANLKVGMKLEATDRANPSMICVATVVEIDPLGHPEAPIRIHFDGWTDKYDYWASVKSADLHRIGHCQATGHRLEKPKGYEAIIVQSSDEDSDSDSIDMDVKLDVGGHFRWDMYLAEEAAVGVPASFFEDSLKARRAVAVAAGGGASHSHPAYQHVEVGMKLEAASGEDEDIRVATIVEIDLKGRKAAPLRIHFDGYDGEYCWVSYDSEHLFPINHSQDEGLNLDVPPEDNADIHLDYSPEDCRGEWGGFSWDLYFEVVGGTAVPDEFFYPDTDEEYAEEIVYYDTDDGSGSVDSASPVEGISPFAGFGFKEPEFKEMKTPFNMEAFAKPEGLQPPLPPPVHKAADLRCKGKQHSWSLGPSRICTKCNLCTTFGSACHIARGSEAVAPSIGVEVLCGCGMGHVGCEHCSICLACHEAEPGTAVSSDTNLVTEPAAESVPEAVPILPLSLNTGNETVRTVAIAAGNAHWFVLLDDGSVFACGTNCDGRLGLGDQIDRAVPAKLSFDFGSKVVDIAAGESHSMFLCEDGSIYSAGPQESENDPGPTLKTYSPQLVSNSELSGATSVWAWEKRTFFLCGNAIAIDNNLQRASCIGTRSEVALLFPTRKGSIAPPVVSLNVQLGTCRSLVTYGEDTEVTNLECLWSIDSIHGIVLSCGRENEILSVMHPCAGSIDLAFASTSNKNNHLLTLNPAAVLPTDADNISAGSVAALTLTSLCGLALGSVPVVDSQEAAAPLEKQWSPADYTICNRFKSSGGSWGYSGSDDAIAFTVDQSVICPGVGLYGQPTFTATVRLYDTSDAGGSPKEGSELARSDTDASFGLLPAETDEWHRIMFDHPVLLEADVKYSIRASIKGGGHSSKSGSGGQRKVEADGGVNFAFHHSSQSHNGTDTNSGQIPVIMFRIPTSKKSPTLLKSASTTTSTTAGATKTPSIPKSLSSPLSSEGAGSVLQLLRWCMDAYSTDSGTSISGGSAYLAHLGSTCLHFLQTFIRSRFEKDRLGDLTCRLFKNIQSEADMMLFLEIRDVLTQLMDIESPPSDRFATLITEAFNIYLTCFAVFHPSAVCRARLLTTLLEVRGGAGTLALLQATIRFLASSKMGLHGLFDARPNSDEQDSGTKAGGENGKEVEGREAIAAITVSTATHDVDNLWDKTSSYWESSGNSGTHWIMIEMLPGVAIKSLQLCYPVSSGDSYRPSEMRVDVGDTDALSEDDRVETLTCQQGKPETEVLADSDGQIKFVKVGISASGINCRINSVACTGYLRTATTSSSMSVETNPYTNFVERHDHTSYEYVEDDQTAGNTSNGLENCIMQLVRITTTEGLDSVKRNELFADIRFLVKSCLDSLTMLQRQAKGRTNVESSVDTKLVAVFLTILRECRDALRATESAQVAEALNEQPIFKIMADIVSYVGIAVKSSGYVAEELASTVQDIFTIISDLQSTASLLNFDGQCKALVDAQSDTHVVAESKHPYLPADIDSQTISFPKRVEWMVFRFRPQCSTAQAEDCVQVCGVGVGAPIYASFSGKNWPSHAVVVPGNKAEIRLTSGSPGPDADPNPSSNYGYSATVSGHRPQHTCGSPLDRLGREIALIGASAVTGLMQHAADAVVATVSSNPAAQPWLESALLSHGLLNEPSELQSRTHPVAAFLNDFVELQKSTPGGAIAAWLQTDRPIDPEQCSMHPLIPQSSDQELSRGELYSCLVCTRSFDGTVVHDPAIELNMSVDYEATDSETTAEESTNTGPELAAGTEIDVLDDDRVYTYSSVTTDAACNQSPEELRMAHIAASKGFSNQSLLRPGIHKLSWSPERGGKLTLTVLIGGQHIAGSPFEYHVRDRSKTADPVPKEAGSDSSDGPASTAAASLSATASLDVVMGNTSRRVRCLVDGHAVRAGSSYEAFEIGVLKKGATFLMSGQSVTTAEGIWLMVEKGSKVDGIDQHMQHLDAWVLQAKSALPRPLSPDDIAIPGLARVVGPRVEDMPDMGEDPEEDIDDEGDDDEDDDGGAEAPVDMVGVLGAEDDADALEGGVNQFGGVFLEEMDGTMLPAYSVADASADDVDAFESEDADAGAAGGGAAPAEAEDWSCIACTFLNPAHKPVCEMCGTAAPPPEVVELPAPAEAAAADEPHDMFQFAPQRSSSIDEDELGFAKSEEDDLFSRLPTAITASCSEVTAKRIRASFAAYLWHSGQATAVLKLATEQTSSFPDRNQVGVIRGASTSTGTEPFHEAVELYDADWDGMHNDDYVVGTRVWAWPPGSIVPKPGRITSVATVSAAASIGNRLVGMKLEAKDRKNPRMVCVATIEEVVNADEGLVKIHFDGWKPEFNYEAKLDNEDLHPMGYCDWKQRKLEVPKGHKGVFSWGRYLQTTKSAAVPISVLSHESNHAGPDSLFTRAAAAARLPGTVASAYHPHPLKILLPSNTTDGACEKCSRELRGLMAHQSTAMPAYKLCVDCVGGCPVLPSPDAKVAEVKFDDDDTSHTCHVTDLRPRDDVPIGAVDPVVFQKDDIPPDAPEGAGDDADSMDVAMLVGMGFSEVQSRRALKSVDGAGVEAASNWLFDNVLDGALVAEIAQTTAGAATHEESDDLPPASDAPALADIGDGDGNGDGNDDGDGDDSVLTMKRVVQQWSDVTGAIDTSPYTGKSHRNRALSHLRVIRAWYGAGTDKLGMLLGSDVTAAVMVLLPEGELNGNYYEMFGKKSAAADAVSQTGTSTLTVHYVCGKRVATLTAREGMPLVIDPLSGTIALGQPRKAGISDGVEGKTERGGGGPSEVDLVTENALLLLSFAPKVGESIDSFDFQATGASADAPQAVFALMQGAPSCKGLSKVADATSTQPPASTPLPETETESAMHVAAMHVPAGSPADKGQIMEQIALLLQSRASSDEIRANFSASSSHASRLAMAFTMLNHFLQRASSLEVVYDLLWTAVSALRAMSSDTAAAAKDEAQEESCPWPLVSHPLLDLEAPADAVRSVETALYQMLTTILRFGEHLPSDNPLQLVVARCWAIDFRAEDFEFVRRSQFIEVMGRVSAAAAEVGGLKGSEVDAGLTDGCSAGGATSPPAAPSGQLTTTAQVDRELIMLTVGSKPAQLGHLTDGSTENAWESEGVSERNCTITLKLDKCEDPGVAEIALYVDNVKDVRQTMSQIKVMNGADVSDLAVIATLPVLPTHRGWLKIAAPKRTFGRLVTLTMTAVPGKDAVRVRQIRAFHPAAAAVVLVQDSIVALSANELGQEGGASSPKTKPLSDVAIRIAYLAHDKECPEPITDLNRSSILKELAKLDAANGSVRKASASSTATVSAAAAAAAAAADVPVPAGFTQLEREQQQATQMMTFFKWLVLGVLRGTVAFCPVLPHTGTLRQQVVDLIMGLGPSVAGLQKLAVAHVVGGLAGEMVRGVGGAEAAQPDQHLASGEVMIDALLAMMPAIVATSDVHALMRPENQLLRSLVRIVHSGSVWCSFL